MASPRSGTTCQGALAQALVLRGSQDFASLEAYEDFVRDVVERRMNRPSRTGSRWSARSAAAAVPRVPDYTTHHPTVRRWSTVRVGKRTYSVPSRLIGHQVEARQHPDVVEVYYRGQLVETMPRLRADGDVRIDYRHVIWSLVRKPGAFARYRYREELFPTLTFRRAYDALSAARRPRRRRVRAHPAPGREHAGAPGRARAGRAARRRRALRLREVRQRTSPEPIAVPR